MNDRFESESFLVKRIFEELEAVEDQVLYVLRFGRCQPYR